jgi:hypothetical protein
MIQVYSDSQKLNSTLIVAPHFLADADLPPSGYLYWAVHGWASGNDSLDNNALSSYGALDYLIESIVKSGHFPNLKQIIITGLSAGGQFTQRYAAGSYLENKFTNIHFRYIIASPSSYMYLDEYRLVQDAKETFSPVSTNDCDFNTYRYGLKNRNRYMSMKSDTQIVEDFKNRDIVLMVGEEDNSTGLNSASVPNDPKDPADLDVSCAAELQGSSRLERAQIFKSYLDFKFPGLVHPLIIGPGIAHQMKLYSTPKIQDWL